MREVTNFFVQESNSTDTDMEAINPTPIYACIAAYCFGGLIALGAMSAFIFGVSVYCSMKEQKRKSGRQLI